jgi:hypothetical protein
MCTCVRLRAAMMRPSPCARGYIRRYISPTHTSGTIYVYLYRCKSQVCIWVRLCVLAYACDRVRALTMLSYAACVRVRRALFVRPSIDETRTGMVYRYVLHACICIHARLATHTCCELGLARNPNPCEPCPSAVDCVRLRRAGVLLGEGVQREHRRVEHRACRLVGLGMRRSRPGGAHYGGTRSAGLRCGAALSARRHRRCARACAHGQELAWAGPWV